MLIDFDRPDGEENIHWQNDIIENKKIRTRINLFGSVGCAVIITALIFGDKKFSLLTLIGICIGFNNCLLHFRENY